MGNYEIYANVYNSMPTFLIFRTASIHTTLKGADARGLTTAIETCIKSLPAGASGKSLYATPGRTLGGSPSPRTSLNRPFSKTLEDWFNAIIAFMGLYVISLFSLDPYTAAEQSAFNVKTHPKPGMPGGGPRRLGGVGRVSPRGAPVNGCAGGNCG
jgi:thioredoxin 1